MRIFIIKLFKYVKVIICISINTLTHSGIEEGVKEHTVKSIMEDEDNKKCRIDQLTRRGIHPVKEEPL